MLEVQLALVKGSRPQRFRMRRSNAVVGRKKGCDLRIPSPEVSRRHCIFRIERDCVTIEDLGSSNGTYLNEDKVETRKVVRPGDHVRIGPIVFVAEYQLSQAAMERLAIVDVEPIDDEVDVELVGDMPAVPPIDEVEVVGDESGMIPVESSDAIPPLKPRQDAPTLRSGPRDDSDDDSDDVQPAPDGSVAEVFEDWQMPPGK